MTKKDIKNKYTQIIQGLECHLQVVNNEFYEALKEDNITKNVIKDLYIFKARDVIKAIGLVSNENTKKHILRLSQQYKKYNGQIDTMNEILKDL